MNKPAAQPAKQDVASFSVISGSTVARLVDDDMEGIVTVVREAYLAHARGHTVNPASVFLRPGVVANSRIIALPAHVGSPWSVSGIKWIASFPDNVQNGISRASAVLILNDDQNGFPYACLEASIISAARTAASAALAADHLSSCGRRAKTVAVIGTGLISRYIYRFLIAMNWEIDQLRLYDIVPSEAERFSETLLCRDKHRSVIIDKSVESAVSNADLVIFATVASKPHVFGPNVFANRPVTVLNISLRDICPTILLESCNIVDDIDHVLQAETSAHLAERLSGSREFITGTLADVIAKKCPVDWRRPVIFSPFGLGMLDVAVGKWIFDRAVAAGEEVTVPGFFHDM